MSHPEPGKEYHEDKPLYQKVPIRKFCNRCQRFLKPGKTMKNHRKGFEHKTGFPSWTQAF